MNRSPLPPSSVPSKPPLRSRLIRHFPLHVHISTLFLLMLIVVGSAIGGLGYSISRDILNTSSAAITERIGRETVSEFIHTLEPAEMATRLLSLSELPRAKNFTQRMALLGMMRAGLHDASELTSIYAGYANGDFFLLRRISTEKEQVFFKAPAGTAFIVQSIEHTGGQAQGQFIYMNAQLKILRSDIRPDYAQSYDPRQRDWYKNALVSEEQIKLPPYLFFTTHKIGTSIASRSTTDGAIIGSDIRLDSLSRVLALQKGTPNALTLLVNSRGQILAHEDHSKLLKIPDSPEDTVKLATLSDIDHPALRQLADTVKNATGNATLNVLINADDEVWRASIRPADIQGMKSVFLINIIPESELMAASHQLIQHAGLVTLIFILLTAPITWLLARAVSKPLRTLAQEAESIRHFEFSKPIVVNSIVLEVNELAQIMGHMKVAIQRFLDVSHAVAAEHNFDLLLPKLLGETISSAGAQAGVLYLANDGLLVAASALNADGSTFPIDKNAPDPASSPLMQSALTHKTAQTNALSAEDISALALPHTAQSNTHAIAVPLINRQQELLGAMVLLLKQETNSARLHFIGALSGSAAVTLEAKELIHAQKRLFEAMIQLIAGAIDAKSAYTGGHCARVPELTKMLARAACEQDSGLYKDFQLNDDQWEELHVAAWLHDCGKVTTPEYVVDKATKLETLYDRIHEVRMRFEVLKRDAEIICLKAIAAGGNESEARADFSADIAQLDEDYRFVATCNEGGEFMAEDKKARLKTIAERTWLRTLDDRIGIAHEEKERKQRSPAPALPVKESLLADKAEHHFLREAKDQMPEDNRWGFRMPVPELLYNKGELYNLCVERGTLSAEERYKINEHIVQTFIMLSQLPFPKHLRNVPEIASGHHEKMDGSGYPRRLHKDEMSDLARMMAIADIFEALTAVDRPYKKGKTLSEAIKIMSFMKKDQHIDPELFDLFLRSGVYLTYAERFMRPEQIDAVDISSYLSPKLGADNPSTPAKPA